MSDNLQNKTISGFFWRFAERCGAQGVSFFVSLALARLLMPEAYGTIALVSVFTNILFTFVNCGLNGALIQKKDVDDLDYASVFLFSLGMCTVLYIGVFVTAPYIAQFYGRPELTTLTRVISLTFFISAFKSGQTAYATRRLLFKKYFFATLGGTLLSAVVGITMAYYGFGAWALVAQSMTNDIVDTIVLWFTVKWRPKLMFSWQRMKGLWSYSWKMLVSGLLDTVYNNLRSLIIGKMYSATDLAYYNKAQTLPSMVISNVNSSIDSVLFPVMSSAQDNVVRVKEMTRRAMKTSTYVMAPLMMGLAFVGEPLIKLLLTEKWLPCVPYMTIFCITYMFYPVHTANLNAIKAMGRSDLFLKLEIVKKVMGLTVLALTMWHGVMVMAYSLLFTSVLSQIINSWPNKKLLNYGYLEQLKDILPGILLAVVMGFCIYPIQWLGLPDIVTLLIQVPLGAVIYFGLSALLKLESFTYLWGMVKPIIMKKFR